MTVRSVSVTRERTDDDVDEEDVDEVPPPAPTSLSGDMYDDDDEDRGFD